MDQRRLHVFVSGRVQGVYYRESTRVQAEQCGVDGWIKNLPDGRVEAILEGEERAVEEVLNFMRRGPEFAKVEQIEFSEEPATGEFSEFSVSRKS